KPGTPDHLILHRGKLVTIEMKSRQGRCSASQREARLAIRAAGGDWGGCRSAHAAMWALRKSGVKLRTIAPEDDTTERWWQPRLAPWEVPRRDPAERRPNAPEGRPSWEGVWRNPLACTHKSAIVRQSLVPQTTCAGLRLMLRRSSSAVATSR